MGCLCRFSIFFGMDGAFSEAVGGVLLILGLLPVHLPFLPFLCTMAVAVFIQQWGAGTWNMLPALGFMGLTLSFGTRIRQMGLDFWFAKVYTWLRRKKWGNLLIYLVSAITLIVLLIYGGVQDVKKQTLIIHAYSKMVWCL